MKQLFIAFAFLLNSELSHARDRVVGQTLLSDQPDTDIVRISSCSANDWVIATSLRIEVLRDPAKIDAFVVTFGNGQRQRLPVQQIIPQGTTTRWFDLVGSRRCIERIRIEGEAVGPQWGRQSLVRFIARDADFPPPPSSGVGLIGQTWLSDQPDSDIIHISSCSPGDRTLARALQVRIGAAAAHIRQIVAVYGNGQRDLLEVQEIFPAGGHSKWVDLIGGTRCIRSIRVVGEALGQTPWEQSLVRIFGIN